MTLATCQSRMKFLGVFREHTRVSRSIRYTLYLEVMSDAMNT